MDKDLEGLNHDFIQKCQTVLSRCKEQGFVLEPFFGLRTPWQQARLFRQSRSTALVNQEAEKLRKKGAPWLAGVLVSVGPQKTAPWATNALPGLSWHNHGLALDCFVLERGKAIWATDHPGYAAYAANSRLVGLEAGFYWPKLIQDAVHIQAPKKEVTDMYSYDQIDKMMFDKFNGKGS